MTMDRTNHSRAIELAREYRLKGDLGWAVFYLGLARLHRSNLTVFRAMRTVRKMVSA